MTEPDSNHVGVCVCPLSCLLNMSQAEESNTQAPLLPETQHKMLHGHVAGMEGGNSCRHKLSGVVFKFRSM